MTAATRDLVVIGSGPAGQKAAVQAAKLGKRVTLVERDPQLGGACVYRGTIPSKTLRENALRLVQLRKNAQLVNAQTQENLEIATLIHRLDQVLVTMDQTITAQLERNQIECLHGQARFVDSHELEVTRVRGAPVRLRAAHIVIATGSRPRQPDHVTVDHEHILDSDSILSLLYLPKSLLVLGGGVIASEYASIFASLGVAVTMVDRYPRPLGFLDQDLTDKFLHAFTVAGGRFLGERRVRQAAHDGISEVVLELDDGETLRAEKMLVAAGREANVQGLDLAQAGLTLNDQGLIDVDDHCRTAVAHIFAAGDVIGPPSLASASMEQGRRASCSAFGIDLGRIQALLPVGIYGIPELSSVGLSEAQARQQGEVIVGRARFEEIARGQISDIQDGLLKLVADGRGEKLLGVQIIGEGATELIHIGQMALLAEADVDLFVESVFNFPTLAEAYRVAALAIIGQRRRWPQSQVRT